MSDVDAEVSKRWRTVFCERWPHNTSPLEAGGVQDYDGFSYRGAGNIGPRKRDSDAVYGHAVQQDAIVTGGKRDTRALQVIQSHYVCKLLADPHFAPYLARVHDLEIRVKPVALHLRWSSTCKYVAPISATSKALPSPVLGNKWMWFATTTSDILCAVELVVIFRPIDLAYSPLPHVIDVDLLVARSRTRGPPASVDRLHSSGRRGMPRAHGSGQLVFD
ncbi:hypothetical protein B0H19DRAFT_1272045 [Mycena capillaripes]|nr:hypothetical protein B0H19DRAFT_1272045 [Mycena capillaripes]